MGMSPIVIPTFWNTEKASKASAPEHSIRPSGSLAIWAARNSRNTITLNRATTSRPPANPSCSPTAVKMKSVCWAGTKPPLVAAPMKDPGTEGPPGGDGQYRLGEIPVGTGRAGVLMEERRETLQLVGVDQLEMDRPCQAPDRRQGKHDQVSEPRPEVTIMTVSTTVMIRAVPASGCL